MTPLENSLACPYCDKPCAFGYGICHCGCGQKTRLQSRTRPTRDLIKGRPSKFISGHNWFAQRRNLDNLGTFKIDGVYCRLLPLTQNLYAIVDSDLYPTLSQHNWYALWNPRLHAFYAARKTMADGRGFTVYMHREVLGLRFGDKRKADHKEVLATLDNRSLNLRIASGSESQANRSTPSTNTSGLKGASLCKPLGKWIGSIHYSGKTHYLGLFATKEEAHQAYCDAAKERFGEFFRKG